MGFLAHICVEDGEMATVGAPIAYVAETEAEIPEAQAKAAAASGGAAPAPAAALGGKRRRSPLLLLLRRCGTGAGCGTSTGASCEHWTNRCHAIREEAREEVEN